MSLIYRKLNSFGLTDIWSIEQSLGDGKWVVKKNNTAWIGFTTKQEALEFIAKIGEAHG